MRFYTLILTLCILIPVSAFAQLGWERTYGDTGNDVGSSVQQTSDGGYIVAVTSNSLGNGYKVYLLKTNASGDTEWRSTPFGRVSDRWYSGAVRQTYDGGYIYTGRTNDGDAANAFLVKTDTSGGTQWMRGAYGGRYWDAFFDVQQTTDTGYIAVGGTKSFEDTVWGDVYLVKTNAQLFVQWTKTYGRSGVDVGWSVRQTLDGGYIIAGHTGGGNGSNVYVIKTNASGDSLWTRTYGGPLEDIGYSVQQTPDTGYIIAGSTNSFGAGVLDVYLIKTNASGDTLWTRTYGGSSNEVANSVQQTLDGGYIIAGTTRSFGAGGQNVYLIKTDASGDTLWTRTFGGDSTDQGNSVWPTQDSGYIVAGLTRSFGAGGNDIYLIKVAPDSSSVGATETPNAPGRTACSAATLIRGVLTLPASSVMRKASCVLLGISGRKLLDLSPGPNDVSRLTPGVYFIRGTQAQTQTIRKVVVTR